MKKTFMSAAIIAAMMTASATSAVAVEVNSQESCMTDEYVNFIVECESDMSDAELEDRYVLWCEEEMLRIMANPLAAAEDYAANRKTTACTEGVVLPNGKIVLPNEARLKEAIRSAIELGILPREPRVRRPQGIVDDFSVGVTLHSRQRSAIKRAKVAEQASALIQKYEERKQSLFAPRKEEVVTYRYMNKIHVTSDKELIARLDKKQIIHRMFANI